MLRTLVAERFKLTQHTEMREMRVYELVVAKSGSKFNRLMRTNRKDASRISFPRDMRQFADLLSVQLSIPSADNPNEPARASTSPTPVLDKTGLPGIFDFSVDITLNWALMDSRPGKGRWKISWG